MLPGAQGLVYVRVNGNFFIDPQTPRKYISLVFLEVAQPVDNGKLHQRLVPSFEKAEYLLGH